MYFLLQIKIQLLYLTNKYKMGIYRDTYSNRAAICTTFLTHAACNWVSLLDLLLNPVYHFYQLRVNCFTIYYHQYCPTLNLLSEISQLFFMF